MIVQQQAGRGHGMTVGSEIHQAQNGKDAILTIEANFIWHQASPGKRAGHTRRAAAGTALCYVKGSLFISGPE